MIKILTLGITPFEQNFRLLYDEDRNEFIFIDPGGDVPEIERILDSENIKINSDVKILLTHSHIDHGGGVSDMKDLLLAKYKVKSALFFHRDNDLYKDTIEAQAELYGLSGMGFKNVPNADTYIEEDDVISFSDVTIKCLYTPGHAPGHISFYFEDGEFSLRTLSLQQGYHDTYQHSGPLLIAGDALFRESIGRTDLPGGDHKQLVNSIRSKLYTLPQETLVLSGHGPKTTISHELKFNPFVNFLGA